MSVCELPGFCWVTDSLPGWPVLVEITLSALTSVKRESVNQFPDGNDLVARLN